MKPKINLDVIAETEEEKQIEKYLEALHNSSEIQNFLNSMREEAKRRNVFKYRDRIKNPKSAIRTYRINHKKLEDAHDYVGITFITYNEKEIYPIVNYLKEKLLNAEFVDFVSEEMIYSPLVYIKWVPPLGYNIFAKEKLIPDQADVPIEIRICSKEAYISEQAAYYSVQKNDNINIPMEEKNKLRNIVQHITYKFALLSIRDLTEKEKDKNRKELNELLNSNLEFLKKHNDLCKEAILDFGRLVYENQNDSEIERNKINLTQSGINDVDEYLKNRFSVLLDDKKDNVINTVLEATDKLKGISVIN